MRHLRPSLRRAAVIFTAAATLLAIVLRVALMPQMLDSDTGLFHISTRIIVFLTICMAAVFALVLAGTQPLTPPPLSDRRFRIPAAVVSFLTGLVFIVTTTVDIGVWAAYGVTPPPNDQIINALDAATLRLTLAFALMSGGFFLALGVRLFSGREKKSSGWAMGALLPVLWIWMRLVRYQVSYASAIPVAQSFYDFVMLVFTMLFLFSFARYISSTGKSSGRMVLGYALCTVLMSVSGSVTQLVFYLSGEYAEFNASPLAGVIDFFIGVFAFCVVLAMTFSRRALPAAAPPSPPAGEVPVPAEPEAVPEGGLPTVDEILKGLGKQSHPL